MPKPTYNPPAVTAGLEAWDAEVTDGFQQVKDVFVTGPMPIPKHAGDESDLAATYPPGNFVECILFVQHTVLGLSLCYSDGTNWRLVEDSGVIVA